MERAADDAEAVITAKINEDFVGAAAESGLAAATARFGHTTATRLGALPDHPAYNRARGFTIDDIEHLAAVREFFAGSAPVIEVWAGDASAELGRRLALAGFFAAEVNVTLRAPSRPGAVTPDPGPDVREVSGDDARYLTTLFGGYGLTHAAAAQRAMMAIEHRSPYLRRYIAYVDGKPASAAGLYLAGGNAYFAGAATLPGLRGRGCQTALIRRRLHDAATTARHVVVTTAFGSPSQVNLQRLDFGIVHTRTLWRPLRRD